MAQTDTVTYIKVTQVKSVIGRIEPQKRTARALGLGRINSSSILPDNPAVRGMVKAVAHLVKVESAEKPAKKNTRRAKAVRTVKAEVASLPKEQASRNDGITREVKVKAKPKTAAKKPATAKPAAEKTTAKVAVEAKKAVVKAKPAAKPRTTAKKATPTSTKKTVPTKKTAGADKPAGASKEIK